MTAQPSTAEPAPLEYEERAAADIPQPSRRLEITVALIALLFNIAVLYLSSQIELRLEPRPGQMDARFWPALLAIVGGSLSAWRLLIAIFRPADERDDVELIRPNGPKRLLITLAYTVAYVALWGVGTLTIGTLKISLFLVSTPILLAALVYLYGGRNWKALIIYPLLMTAFIYGLFGMLLRIPL